MIRELDGAEALDRVGELAEVLRDCVEGGASVGFMLPLAEGRPEIFWRKVAAGVAAGERHLFVAEDEAGRICGTLSLVIDMPDNQPHRADVSKMLVHRRARRQGIAERLLKAVEAKARELGRTTLVLDTVTGGGPCGAPWAQAVEKGAVAGSEPTLTRAAAARAPVRN